MLSKCLYTSDKLNFWAHLWMQKTLYARLFLWWHTEMPWNTKETHPNTIRFSAFAVCFCLYFLTSRLFFFFFQTRCLCYIIDNDGFICGFRFCHFCSCNALNFQCHRIVCMEISITTVAGCRQWKQKGWNRSSYDTAAQFSLELHTYWAIPHLTIWAGVEFHCRMHAKCKRDRE